MKMKYLKKRNEKKKANKKYLPEEKILYEWKQYW
jgi:hypothetical protein